MRKGEREEGRKEEKKMRTEGRLDRRKIKWKEVKKQGGRNREW